MQKYILKIYLYYQQQLAYILVLTIPHFSHTHSVSLQLSTQHGIQKQIPEIKNKNTHHPKVTQPTFFLIMLSVFF